MLDSSVWAEVATELARLGHRPVAVRLPGADDEVDATLDDQVDAVLAAVDAATGPVLVGHSAASALVWICADRRPTAVGRVVMVGGFPHSDGAAYAPFFPVVDGRMPFPGWEPFEGPDCADLDDATRRRIAAAAHPVPEGVACGVVRLGDPARFDVPVVVVCPEFSPEQARAWVRRARCPSWPRARRSVTSTSMRATGRWCRRRASSPESSTAWLGEPEILASRWQPCAEPVQRNNGVDDGGGGPVRRRCAGDPEPRRSRR